MGDLFKSIKKRNSFASELNDSENVIAKIDKYISTGIPAMNAVISGDLFGGFPTGRITTLFGPSQSGKSFISALAQKGAQKEGMKIIIFDTEFDKDGRLESSLGVDLENVMSVPIESIEELTKEVTNSLNDVIDDPEEWGKYLFVIDSIGFLSSEKILTDITKDKVSNDMGAKAKLIKQFLFI